MNREIKFRAWYQNKIHYNIEKHHIEHHAMSGFSGDVWDFKDWLTYSEVTQYTGLKDKNGKEIYEGDVIHFKDDFDDLFGIIKFNEDWMYFGIEIISNDRLNGESYQIVKSMSPYIEIIGNSYENPELLKQ